MRCTGYASFIIDNKITKASDFLKLCLRAFAILYDYRDEPLGPTIPKELPKDDYHEKELIIAKEKLAKRLAMTDDEWRKEIENHLNDTLKKHEESVKRENAEIERLNAVTAKIEHWNCSEAYESVKRFALEQIAASEPYGDKWYKDIEDTMRKALNNPEDFKMYKETMIECDKHEVEYHKEGAAKAEEEWRKNNEFLAGFWKEIEQLEEVE